MKYSNCAKLLLAAGLAGVWSLGFAQAPQKDLGPAVRRSVAKAEKTSRRAKAAAVSLNFDWEKKVYLFDMVHRRRPGVKNVLVNVEKKSTQCQGVLLAGTNRVVTPVSCAKGKKGFELKRVNLAFANGQKGTGTAGAVSVNGDFAFVAVSSALTRGIEGAQVAAVPEGQSLKETFGDGVSRELALFFINRGVVSARANRLSGAKKTLKVGDPFFYQGKLVALVSDVPSRLPVSLFGGVSEDSLAVFRIGSAAGLIAKK